MIAGGIAAWFVLLGVLWGVRAPRRAERGPVSTDLGPQPPAVANLLTHRFNPTRDAVPATLVDLAARGLVEIEDRGIGRYYCRLTGRTADLDAHEAMLLDHLRSVAAGGEVPAEALTTGPQDRSKAWWSEFRNRVVAGAQSAGLCADLWNGTTKAALVALALLLLVLYGFATGFRDPDDIADSALLNVVLAGGLGVFFALGATFKSTRQTSTGPGLDAASRWLGVREALEESPSFELLPPSGVVVWERHLAYACALGVAPRSTLALPMGAESDTEAWTASGGEWRKVTVRYPRLRPGWGRHPALALALGAVGTYAGYRMSRLATGDLGGLAAVAVSAIAVVFLARSIPQLLWGLLDLFGSRTIEGPVLRARARWGPIPYVTQGDDSEYTRFFVAIDDARSAKLTAYRVSAKVFAVLPQGIEAKLRVTPNLGYVRRPSA